MGRALIEMPRKDRVMMRKIVCTEFGSPELLRIVEEPIPEAGEQEVLIENEAVGVSFVDGLIVQGSYQVKPPLPFTPGNCFVGRVSAVGIGVDEALVGHRVASVTDGIGGAYSSHVVVPAGGLTLVPSEIPSNIAASSIESYLTLLFGISHRVTIESGEKVVVLGAGGGIGLAAVDIARSKGAEVVAVASTDEKRALALASGANIAIGYENLKDEIRKVTGGGADVVFDPVGGDVFDEREVAAGFQYSENFVDYGFFVWNQI